MKKEHNPIADAIEGLRQHKHEDILERYVLYFKATLLLGIVFFIVVASGAELQAFNLTNAHLAVILFGMFLAVVLFTLVDITKTVIDIKNKKAYKPLKRK